MFISNNKKKKKNNDGSGVDDETEVMVWLVTKYLAMFKGEPPTVFLNRRTIFKEILEGAAIARIGAIWVML